MLILELEWEDSREQFRFDVFDVDHLTKDADAVSKVKCSKVCFPRGETCIWRVKCRLEEDDDGHRIKVRYAEDDQKKGLRKWLQNDKNRDYYIGKTTIFVKRNESGKAEKKGRFKWDPEAPNGEIEGQWRAIDGS